MIDYILDQSFSVIVYLTVTFCYTLHRILIYIRYIHKSETITIASKHIYIYTSFQLKFDQRAAPAWLPQEWHQEPLILKLHIPACSDWATLPPAGTARLAAIKVRVPGSFEVRHNVGQLLGVGDQNAIPTQIAIRCCQYPRIASIRLR